MMQFGDRPWSVALRAMGAGFQGGDPNAVVKDYEDGLERARRKEAINSLMSNMGIAGPEKDLLSTMPLEAIQGHLLGKMQPKPVNSVVVGDRLVNSQTGEVIGDYSPTPIDLSAILGSPQGSAVRDGLIKRGFPAHVADAFAVNFYDESGLNPGINERNPIVPGSRGGFGLAQWTGPRRRELEAYAKKRGASPDNMDVQLDFLAEELMGSEVDAARNIFSAGTTGEAAQAIVNDFLRPAEAHRSRRSASYAGLDDQISKLNTVLASGQGTAAQREALEFRRDELVDERERQRQATMTQEEREREQRLREEKFSREDAAAEVQRRQKDREGIDKFRKKYPATSACRSLVRRQRLTAAF